MNSQPITTVSRLISEHQSKNPGSYFFSRDTLKFFGERMSDMRLLKTTERVTDPSGKNHICYVVSSLQRKTPGRPKRVYHYFDVDTLQNILKDEQS